MTEVKGYQLQASAKICISESKGNTNQDIWILAFTEQLEALLAGSNLSLKDKIDNIEVYLTSLEQTTNITKVISFKCPKEKSD